MGQDFLDIQYVPHRSGVEDVGLPGVPHVRTVHQFVRETLRGKIMSKQKERTKRE